MSNQSKMHSTHNKHIFLLERPDPLGILTSTREVMLQARLVQIDIVRIQQMAQQLVTSTKADTEQSLQMIIPPAWPEHYHFFDGTERTVNWMLLLDALNFCFWGEKNQPRWQIDYQGEVVNGYWAEAASLRRAVDEQKPLWDARYLYNMSREELASIFRGLSDSEPGIPLLEERLRITREVGQVLLEHFDGQFSRLIEQAHQSGTALALALARHFSSFRDIALFENQEVRFFKRAQICVADLYSAFQGKSWGTFTDLDQLTIFADYKLPQVLRHYGALIYHPDLAKKIDEQMLLTAGSIEEVEIRAATIWASELLRREIVQLTEQTINAAEIDQLLWHLGQDATAMRPYHRVYTIYY